MEKINLEKYKAKEKKGANSEVADIVFTLMEKYGIDTKETWGKRLSGALLRLSKKNKDLVRRNIGNAEEALDMMKKSEDKHWREAYASIMSSQENKIKFFWNKLLK